MKDRKQSDKKYRGLVESATEGHLQDTTERKPAEEQPILQRDLAERVTSNVEQLIKPYVRKLKASKLDESQKAWLDIIEKNLREITSLFSKNVARFDFTPREREVIQLLKEGRSTKEIAELLSVCPGAIGMHRHRVRKKLGLNKKKTNLQTYLFSLKDGA